MHIIFGGMVRSVMAAAGTCAIPCDSLIPGTDEERSSRYVIHQSLTAGGILCAIIAGKNMKET
ncbi:MAG: hypothetical protein IJS28_04785 [Synergistaceae bacterium]|nr:hypothetical protein [Synergistaceae bacterium]